MSVVGGIAPWRRRTGITLFVLGTVLPGFIPLIYLAGIDGWPAAALTALFSLGLPEVLWFLAAVFIGRDGVKDLWRHVRVRWRLLLRHLRRR
jgi:hypothetical protein